MLEDTWFMLACQAPVENMRHTMTILQINEDVVRLQVAMSNSLDMRDREHLHVHFKIGCTQCLQSYKMCLPESDAG